MICAGITKKSKALCCLKQEREHVVRERNGSSRRARKKAKAYSLVRLDADGQCHKTLSLFFRRGKENPRVLLPI